MCACYDATFGMLCERAAPPCSSPVFFFLMIRRPPRSTLDRSSAASDVYKRQDIEDVGALGQQRLAMRQGGGGGGKRAAVREGVRAVSYTHLRAHETVLDIVCRLLLEKKKKRA